MDLCVSRLFHLLFLFITFNRSLSFTTCIFPTSYTAQTTQTATQNTVDCEFSVSVAGTTFEIVISIPATGSNVVRVYDSTKTTNIATLTSTLTFITFSIPSGTSTYVLAMGCNSNANCNGVVSMSIKTPSPTYSPSIHPTISPTRVPTFRPTSQPSR